MTPDTPRNPSTNNKNRRRTMKTKNIFNILALAVLMPAIIFSTACSKDDNAVNTDNTNKKGYELPVTIKVSRQGDDPATRASYNGTTKKLEFSTGDKLRVRGYNATVGEFGGILDWYSGGTFKGTILTENEYTGTVEDLFTATPGVYASLLPAGYGTYGFISVVEKSGYDNMIMLNETKAFALTKATAIEQFSRETGNYVTSNGFVLAPLYAILNFTITNLTANTEYAIVVSDGSSYDRTGNVTTNGSGTAIFAVGVRGGRESDNITLTVSGTPITLNLFSGTNTALAAGKIYNITRSAVPPLIAGALAGKFTINDSGNQVYFSQGNLQYQASTNTWRFAEHQWDFVGDATNGNVYVGAVKSNNALIASDYSGWIDMFGWGTSGYNHGANCYQPYSTSQEYTDYYAYGSHTYNLRDQTGRADWGYNAISNGGNVENFWRTLTNNEWEYVFNTRSTTSGVKYAKATVNGVAGVILLPDDWNTSYHSLTSTNTASANYTTNNISSSDWTNDFEAHGAVFLPAVGRRWGTSLFNVGERGNYWSTSNGGSSNTANRVYFTSSSLNPHDNNGRYDGYAVRLVKKVD